MCFLPDGTDLESVYLKKMRQMRLVAWCLRIFTGRSNVCGVKKEKKTQLESGLEIFGRLIIEPSDNYAAASVR